jgi:predicted N-acetyltransferase YhbS
VRHLVLREATEEEAVTVAAVVRGAFEEYRDQLAPPSGSHSESAENIRRKMATGRIAVTSLNEMIVGCVFYECRENHVYLGRLSVLPAYRGRGIGQALIEYVEDRARQLGVPRIRLGVRIVLNRLRTYYEQRGYRVVELGKHAGFTEPTYAILEKELSNASDLEGSPGTTKIDPAQH